MSAAEHYTAIVIGSGPGGYPCAIRLGQLGVKTLCIERGDWGGVCLNVGCIPSKALITAGKKYEELNHMAEMGITVPAGSTLDMGKLQQWKGSIVKKLTDGVRTLLKGNKATMMSGTAKFVDAHTLDVTTAEGVKRVTADHIVIATGSRPIEIPGFSFKDDRVMDSTKALALTEVPRRLVVIGGGYIGLELGTMYRKLGSKVTVLEATTGALPGQDRDCVKVIEKNLEKLGVVLLTKTFAKSWTKRGDKKVVTAEVDGQMREIECDQILSTVGRRPNTEGLGLDKLGLAVDKRGFIEVDDQLRTKVPGVFAIGDVAGQPMLAHKGSKEGLVAAAVIAGQPERYDVRCVPAVIFTSPEMASVGLSVEQAKEQGRETKVGQFPFAAAARAMSLMETEGFVKVVADAKTDELLGVHMVGPEVTELIAEATLAIEMGATAEDIARTIHAHPTLPEALMEAAEAVHKMAVHIFQKK